MNADDNFDIQFIDYDAGENRGQYKQFSDLLERTSSFNLQKTEFFYPSSGFPDNYIEIVQKLDIIVDLIKYKTATKEDVDRSTYEIIKEQKKEISEAKELIRELITEIKNRSVSNIFILFSGIGLLLSLSFLILSIFQEKIIFSSFHFILLTILFSLILLLSFLSKRVFK